MNASRKHLKIVLALALVGLLLYSYGCGQSDAQGGDTELCVKCGQIKGSDLCCKPDQTKCDKCAGQRFAGLLQHSQRCKDGLDLRQMRTDKRQRIVLQAGSDQV